MSTHEERLEGEPDATPYPEFKGRQGEECGNCGFDLTAYRAPNAFHKTGRTGCDSCPKCSWDPSWYYTFVKNLDANVITTCTKCGDRNVQRVRARRCRYYMNGPNGVGREKTVDEASEPFDRCSACREESQAAVHYANYQRAVKRAKEKRESQRRGVRRFLEAAAKKAEKQG